MKTSNVNLLAEIDALEDVTRKDASELEVVKEIERLRFLVTQGRHELFKKKLITFEEVSDWK